MEQELGGINKGISEIQFYQDLNLGIKHNIKEYNLEKV